jgi:hypothetical protein
MLLFITKLSDFLKERTFISMTQCLWTLPCVIALRFWPGSMRDAWGTFALVTTLLSFPYCHAILVGWTSKNANNVGARTVSAAVYNSKFLSAYFGVFGTVEANSLNSDGPIWGRDFEQYISRRRQASLPPRKQLAYCSKLPGSCSVPPHKTVLCYSEQAERQQVAADDD